MKNRNVFGIVLLVIGAVLLLKAFGVISDIIFFDGWWTLFLIIPAVVSMSRTGITVGNSILLVLGVGFLLEQQQRLDFGIYLAPALFIVVGIGILFKK